LEKAQALYETLGTKLAGTAPCIAQEHVALGFAARLATAPSTLDGAVQPGQEPHDVRERREQGREGLFSVR
jgi:hypothetical protein